MTRQQQIEIRKYAEQVGLKVVRFEKRSKHDAAILTNGKRERFITLSATPSDFRTGYAIERTIRKTARELRELEPAPVIEAAPVEPVRPWLAPVEQPQAAVVEPAPIQIVYFYTTTAALPFIMLRKVLHDLNEPDLHATESKNGEKTDTGQYRNANRGNDPYRMGVVQRVRFACHASDFEKTGPDTYTRAEDLPLDRVIACDVRSYLGHRWTPFDLKYGGPYNIENTNVPEDAFCLGVEIGGKIYSSYEGTFAGEIDGYAVLTPFPLTAESIS